MAVIQTKGGRGLLGGLGTLATLGGALIPGAQWLTPLGMGMNAMNGMMTADSTAMSNLVNNIICGGWYNPSSGNIARTKPELASGLSDEELARKWGGYNLWRR